MNINCLHEHISPSAYAKGKELLRNGRVKSVSYESNDTWSAEIMELELYMMEIVFDEDELIHWYCDCNYKPGTMCRHIAAFILYLRRIWSDRYFLHGIAEPAPRTRADQPIEYPALSGKYYKEMNTCFKNLKQRLYNACTYVNDNVSVFTTKAYGLIAAEHHEEALAILIQALRHIGNVYGDFKDTSDMLAEKCREASAQILLILKADLPEKLLNSLRVDIGKLMHNDKYCLYNLANLEDILYAIALKAKKPEIDIALIDRLLQSSDLHPSRIYPLLNCKITLLNLSGDNKEIDPLIDSHIHIPPVRKMKIDILIKREQYTDALNLISEGIKMTRYEEDKKDYISDLEDRQITVLRALKDNKKVARLAEKLFLKGKDSIKYYHILKETVPKDDWHKYLNKILRISNLDEHKSLLDAFASIYIEEEMWSALFIFVQKHVRPNHVSTLKLCDPFLKAAYPEKMLKYYRLQILDYAKNSYKREQYEHINHILFLLINYPYGGRQLSYSILSQLKSTYSKRHAFMKELEETEARFADR